MRKSCGIAFPKLTGFWERLIIIFLVSMPSLMMYAYDDDYKDDKTFCFYDNSWKRNGETISEAVVDDRVIISCKTENIPDGARVTIFIWELNYDKNDLAAEL